MDALAPRRFADVVVDEAAKALAGRRLRLDVEVNSSWNRGLWLQRSAHGWEARGEGAVARVEVVPREGGEPVHAATRPILGTAERPFASVNLPVEKGAWTILVTSEGPAGPLTGARMDAWMFY